MPAPQTNTDNCAVLESLKAQGLAIINKFLKKRIQLQRLAQLLLTAGDSIPLPNINFLPNIGSVTAQDYENIVQACPFLGLPPLSDTALGNFKNALYTAYNSLLQQLNNHPWSRLGGLQDELDSLLGQVDGYVNNVLGQGLNVFQCIQVLCGAGQGLYNDITSFQNQVEGADNQLDALKNQFIGQAQAYGKVLQGDAQTKYDNIKAEASALFSKIDIPAPTLTPPKA